MTKVKIDPGPFVVPMPTVLVGAEVDGQPNFMPAAFVGVVNFSPPTVACGLNPDHHTCKGIETNRAFSLNLPGPELVEPTGAGCARARTWTSRGSSRPSPASWPAHP